MEHHERSMKEYALALSQKIKQEYNISEEHYSDHNVKRGLRNEDGTGVLVGVTRVGSVQGYVVDDGGRVPAPGQLYYRGIALTDIVENHRQAKTFGFEDVAYLLLCGSVPTKNELPYINRMLY